MKKYLLSLFLLLISPSILAGSTALDRLETIPELPDPLAIDENIEPQITIIRKDDAVIEEYRINGALYMVKVTPAVGYPYYLLDNDGDGRIDSRRSDLDDVLVPQWVLFTW